MKLMEGRFQGEVQLKEDFTLTRSRHTVKVGFQGSNRRVHFDSDSGDKGQLYYQAIFSAACPQGNDTCAAAQGASGLDAGGLGFADYLMSTLVQSQLILPGARYNPAIGIHPHRYPKDRHSIRLDCSAVEARKCGSRDRGECGSRNWVQTFGCFGWERRGESQL